MVKCFASNTDPVRGRYFDNSKVFELASSFLSRSSACVYHHPGLDFVNNQNGVQFFATSGGHGLNPWATDKTTISFSVSYTSTNQAILYYTSDGSSPRGVEGIPSGSTQTLPCNQTGIFGQPDEKIFTCLPIPPQKAGSKINYILETWNSNTGGSLYANSTDCSLDTCAQVFSYQVQRPATLFLSLMKSYNSLGTP